MRFREEHCLCLGYIVCNRVTFSPFKQHFGHSFKSFSKLFYRISRSNKTQVINKGQGRYFRVGLCYLVKYSADLYQKKYRWNWWSLSQYQSRIHYVDVGGKRSNLAAVIAYRAGLAIAWRSTRSYQDNVFGFGRWQCHGRLSFWTPAHWLPVEHRKICIVHRPGRCTPRPVGHTGRWGVPFRTYILKSRERQYIWI